MEFILVFFLYMAVAVAVSFPLTTSVYKSRLKKLPRNWNADELTEEVALNKELEWRKKQREAAKKSAGWYAVFWALFFPLELILQLVALFNKGADKSLDKEDADVQNKIAAIQARKILDKYEADQKAKFDELVE